MSSAIFAKFCQSSLPRSVCWPPYARSKPRFDWLPHELLLTKVMAFRFQRATASSSPMWCQKPASPVKVTPSAPAFAGATALIHSRRRQFIR